MTTPFVHLHLHTEYSLADGTVRIPQLVRTASDLGMPAVAVTDIANLYGMVKFYRAALSTGVKPVFGVDAWIENPEQPSTPNRLVLLVKNAAGYKNLCELLTRAYRQGQHSERPCISREWLRGHANGLIALSAAQAGDVGAALRAGDRERAESLIDEYLGMFGNGFYLELQRVGRTHEEEYIAGALDLAAGKSVPVVATNDVHFLAEDDFDGHEVRVCIHDGRTLNDPRRPRRFTTQQYYRSVEEMAELFSDVPEALDNTIQIARRCNYFIASGDYYLPAYPVPEGDTIETHLRKKAEEGIAARIGTGPESPAGIPREEYGERMKMELDVITRWDFPVISLLWRISSGGPLRTMCRLVRVGDRALVRLWPTPWGSHSSTPLSMASCSKDF